MKRFKLKINKGLKMAVLLSSLFVTAAVAKVNPRAGVTMAFTGMVMKLKKDKKWDDLDEDTKTFAEAHDAVMKELYDGKLEIKDLGDKLKDLGIKTGMTEAETKEFDEHKETVKKMAAQLEGLKKTAEKLDPSGAIGKALKTNEEKIKSFLAGEKKGKVEIEVKAFQGASDIADHTIGDRVAGIGQLPVRRQVFEPLFPTVTTSKEFIKYMDQETVVRDAKNVAACAPSSHDTKLTWKEYNIQITKVRDMVDICQDMMDDYDFVEGELRNLVYTSVELKVDRGLLLDNGVYPNLHSINEAASEFAADNTLGGTIEPFAGTVQAPNIFDLVIAMSAQVIAVGQDNAYIPNVVAFNTIDKFKNMLIKDKNDNYLMPPFVVKVNNKDYTIDNMVVETSPIVPPNTLYVFDSTKGTIYKRKGIVIELSYENNDNFETETVTMKAYRRLNFLIRNVHKNAFMKCSSVSDALEALTKAV